MSIANLPAPEDPTEQHNVLNEIVCSIIFRPIERQWCVVVKATRSARGILIFPAAPRPEE